MSQNSDRWLRLYESIEAIDNDLNVYIEPVNGADIETPFVIVKPKQLRHLSDSGQGQGVFNGLYATITVGVYTKRDKKSVQKDEIKECIELFEKVHDTIKLETQGIDANIGSDVAGDNMDIYKMSYSGYYNK